MMFAAGAVEDQWSAPLIGVGGLMLTGFSYGVLFTTIAYNWLRSVRPVR